MPAPLMRALLGFAAAVISVLTFHQGTWAVFHAAGLMPLAPYPMVATGILQYPLIVGLMFWGGVYGAVFGLVLPRLSGPLWAWGAGLGLLAATIGWFVVAPLKGMPVASGFDPVAMARSVAINGMWGLGVGLILPALLRAVRSSARSGTAPAA